MIEGPLSFVPHQLLIVLVIICLCSVAVVPLLRGTSPCTHDGGLHYFRTAALRHTVKRGAVFTRWLPDLALGYGFPFFNYRAPLSYYVGLGLHLIGMPLPLALNLLYVLSIVGSALGAYLLARDLFGPRAGVLAAVTYAYAPYQLLDALMRGNAPEIVALALMPFVLWAFRRLALQGGRWWFLGSVVLLVSLYLSHNISSLLFTPFLLAYLVVLWYIHGEQGRWRQVALAFVLGLGLTVFFWLPALAEKQYVQLYLTGATRNNDFRHNFIGLTEIFAPPKAFDTSLMNPPLNVRLGTVQVGLAVIGFALGLRLSWRQGGQEAQPRPPEPEKGWSKRPENQGPKERRVSLVFFALIAALFVFMSTSASIWLWERVPLLPFVQFPWRFVGRASLPVALLAGATLSAVPEARRSSSFTSWLLGLLPSTLIVPVVLAALPSTYPPQGYCPMEPYPTVQDVHRYEHSSGLVGVDPVGAYFPVWVQQRPQETPLEAQYASEDAVARFDASVLPEGGRILEADYGPNRAQIVVESPSPFRARYLSFYFPGWRVWVDGKQVEVEPSDPQGLLTFELSAGRHTISVRFGETPLRLGADAVSLLSLVVLAGVTILGPRLGVFASPESLRLETRQLSPPALLLTAALLLVFKLAVVDQGRTPFRRPALEPDGTVPGVEHPLHQSYADGLELIGYDQSAGEMPADDILRVDLYWTVRRQPAGRYQTVVHLTGPDGMRWSHHDSFRPTDYQDPPPTYAWTPARYALDSHEIEVLPGTPPGRYDVVLTVFDRETLAPLSLLGPQGQPAAPELTLGQVILTAPRHPADPRSLGIRHRLDVGLGPLKLLGANFDRDEAAPGDPIFVTTFWRIDEQPTEAPAMRLELLRADGSVAARYELPPVAPWHPADAWQPSEVWRGQHLLHLPADLNTATYTWTLSLPSCSSSPLSLAQLFVTAPDRTFTQPPVDIEMGAPLDNIATLVGASVEPDASGVEAGTALTVTLVWRAETETDTSYRVFLHLIGPGASTTSEQRGALVVQSDGIPAEWMRPTTGWLAGEFIIDVRHLTIPAEAPAGDYTLYAGLYTSEGGRLSTLGGADAILVTRVTVEGSR